MTDQTAEKVKILLVDDRRENLLSLLAVLADPGYDLVCANSGEEALRKVLREDFALILLDVQMPEIDGFETARLVKMRPRSRDIPIIFITALSKDEPFVFRGYGAGAVDYLFKPFDPYILKSKVAVFADLHRKTKQIEEDLLMLREKEIVERELASLRREQEANQKYRDLMDGVRDGVLWSADPTTGDIRFIGPQAEAVSGYTVEEMLADPKLYLSRLIRIERLTLFAQIVPLMRTGGDLSLEHRFVRKDGSTIWLKSTIWLARMAEGLELRGLSVSVTQLKKAEEDAVAAVRIRDNFLSIASHELKTPLTSLRLQLQLLGRTITKEAPPEVTREKVTKATDASLRQVERLGSLIDELLDVARIESGQMQLRREPVNLCEMVTDVAAKFAEELRTSGCTLKLELGDPFHGHWDRLRIEQVVVNLVSNAIKYGRGQPIEISINQNPEEGCTRLRIRDHGVGIPKEAQSRIFKRFERAVTSSDYKGLGLGLYIVTEILMAHGGSIDVSSEPGQGSVFTVDLPTGMAALPSDGGGLTTSLNSYASSPERIASNKLDLTSH